MTNSRKHRLVLALMVVAISVGSAPAPAEAEWSVGTPIATYYCDSGLPLTDARAQVMAQGGWNLVWASSLPDLNTAYQHGLRVMWLGALDDATVTTIRNHPALYSYYVTDEPSATRFPELASTVSRLRTLDPDHMAYINLFPTYASSSQLGASDYRTYLNQYMSTVQPELLSYDHYQFMAGGDASDYFKNLAVISHTAKQAGIPFVNIVQACSWDPVVRTPTGNELRYLYNTSLAYGAQGVSDFVYYWAAATGGMVQGDGVTTTTLYDAAKTINPRFVAMAEEVQPMCHIGAYHVGDLPPGYGTSDGSSPLRLPGGSPFTISGIATTTYQDGKPVRGAVLGLYGPDDQLADATCTVAVNLDYSNPLSTRVSGPGDLSVFDPETGQWVAQGHAWADVTLLPGGSVLVGLTSAVPEPATLSLLALGGVALLRRKKYSL